MNEKSADPVITRIHRLLLIALSVHASGLSAAYVNQPALCTASRCVYEGECGRRDSRGRC